ncbi:MAG: trypsin-like peptidase domain-containing protein [Acidimicrobiia bacterium]
MNDNVPTPESPNWYTSPPDVAPVPQPRSRRHRWLAGAAAVVIVAVSAAAGAALELSVHGGSSAPNASRFIAPSTNGSGTNGSGSFTDPFDDGTDGSSGSSGSSAGNTSLDVGAIAANVNPAVVNIATNVEGGGQAAGTGIVLTPSGRVLTNNHVINGATKVRVEVGVTGKVYNADVLGYDVADDVALLQLQHASGMKTAKLDTSGSVSTNDQIVAIGNALGHFGTPTAVDGIVTGTHRTITAGDDNANTETLSDMIQIQADIQPGDSGGPIVDADAEVIGVTTAADAGSGRFGFRAGNTGFAIPIAKAMGVARKIEAGTATDRIHIGGNRALLGVLLDDQAGGLGDRSSGDGAPVARVESGSAADKAGVEAGATITGLDGHAITSPSDLRTALNAHQPSDRVTITWADSSGQQHRASTQLGSGPPA